MKKRAAFLLGLILLLALLLTACNNAVTSVSIRWNDKEEFIFDIELADFNTSENAKTFFNTYSDNNKTYYKDFAYVRYGRERIRYFRSITSRRR